MHECVEVPGASVELSQHVQHHSSLCLPCAPMYASTPRNTPPRHPTASNVEGGDKLLPLHLVWGWLLHFRIQPTYLKSAMLPRCRILRFLGSGLAGILWARVAVFVEIHWCALVHYTLLTVQFSLGARIWGVWEVELLWGEWASSGLASCRVHLVKLFSMQRFKFPGTKEFFKSANR